MNFIFIFFYFAVLRASTDGQPHETLTLVVCTSGLFVAIIFIALIVMVIRKDKRRETHMLSQTAKSYGNVEAQKVEKQPTDRKPMRIFTIFSTSQKSFDLWTSRLAEREYIEKDSDNQLEVFCIWILVNYMYLLFREYIFVWKFKLWLTKNWLLWKYYLVVIIKITIIW